MFDYFLNVGYYVLVTIFIFIFYLFILHWLTSYDMIALLFVIKYMDLLCFILLLVEDV